MGNKKDIERALSGKLFRYGLLVNTSPGDKLKSDDIKYGNKLILTCGVCHRTFTEDMADTHLKTCQPNGAICGRCGHKFLPHEFIGHFKKCLGRIAIQ